MKRSRYALPYQVWMALFILVPIFIVLYYACTTSDGASVSFSLENLAQVFSPTYLTVLVRSLWIALVATLICLVIGYPVASILASRHFKRSSLMLMLIIIPMWMNFLLRTYAWINLLDTNGLIAKLLGLVGLGNVSLLYNTTAVIIGLVYKWFGRDMLERLFDSWLGDVRQAVMDDLAWLALESAVYQKELPGRPALEELRQDHAREFFAMEYQTSRQEWMARNQLVYSMQAARWKNVLGKPDRLVTPWDKGLYRALCCGDVSGEELEQALRACFRKYLGFDGKVRTKAERLPVDQARWQGAS